MNVKRIDELVNYLRFDNVGCFDMGRHEHCIMGKAAILFNNPSLHTTFDLREFLDVPEERFEDFRLLLACGSWGLSQKACNNQHLDNPIVASFALEAWALGATASEAWESV